LEMSLEQRGESTVRLTPKFQLASDENPEASHCTIVQWVRGQENRAIVTWDLTPTAVRRTPEATLEKIFRRKLPPKSRARWRGLMRAGNQQLIKSAMWNARGAPPEKHASHVLENVAKDAQAGLPSRRSRLRNVPLPDSEDLFGGNPS